MQAIDYEMKLGELNARLEAFSEQVQRALNETGAPTLDEVVARLKRFALQNKQLAHSQVEVTARHEEQKSEIARLNGLVEQLNGELRDVKAKLADQAAANAVHIDTIHKKNAALKLASDLLDLPMFTAFRDDVRPVQKSINAALRGSEG